MILRFRSCRRHHAAAFLELALLANLAACTQSAAPPPPDPAAVLQSIAPSDPAKYPPQQQPKRWANPYLVIGKDRVGLLNATAANEEQMLKPEDVLNALARLPASAWPYGRAVAILIEEKPTSTEQDKIALRRNRGIVEGDLRQAHVAIRWISAS